MRLLLTLLLTLTLGAAPVHAEDVAQPAPAKKAEAPAPAKTDAPAATAKPAPAINPLKRLDARTEDMMKGLDENQTKQFMIIRTAHGAIRGVDNVKVSLDRAVKSCVKANPDLNDTMTTRFQDWKNAVLPVVRQGENRLEKMILLQEFARPSQVRAYLKVFDEAVKFQNSQFQEVPVSDKDACEDMADNMKDSHKRLTELLTETLGLDKDPTVVEKPAVTKTKN